MVPKHRHPRNVATGIMDSTSWTSEYPGKEQQAGCISVTESLAESWRVELALFCRMSSTIQRERNTSGSPVEGAKAKLIACNEENGSRQRKSSCN